MITTSRPISLSPGPKPDFWSLAIHILPEHNNVTPRVERVAAETLPTGKLTIRIWSHRADTFQFTEQERIYCKAG